MRPIPVPIASRHGCVAALTTHIDLTTHHTLVEDNEFSGGNLGAELVGTHNIVRNNLFSDQLVGVKVRHEEMYNWNVPGSILTIGTDDSFVFEQAIVPSKYPLAEAISDARVTKASADCPCVGILDIDLDEDGTEEACDWAEICDDVEFRELVSYERLTTTKARITVAEPFAEVAEDDALMISRSITDLEITENTFRYGTSLAFSTTKKAAVSTEQPSLRRVVFSDNLIVDTPVASIAQSPRGRVIGACE